MNALVFTFSLGKLAKAKLRGRKDPSGYWRLGGPVGIQQVPHPKLVADDWVIVKTALSGICGSDMHELQLEGAMDNPLRSLLSFPQIMGHEAVGFIEKVGTKATKVKVGDRVAISPWFPCKTRGIIPECPRCQIGDFTHCHNFNRGYLPVGMHLGVTTGFGTDAPFFAVHESQCFRIPENVTFEQAVLADPFSVAFHSCLLLTPLPDQTILVYGLGIIGICTILCLKYLFGVKRVLAVGRYDFQVKHALQLGVERVFTSSGSSLVEEIINYIGSELYIPRKGLKWAMDGVDAVIDTIASARTIEVGLRILSTQGKLVIMGVSTPARCENTPHYFKELEIFGSAGFSIENFEGRRAHAIEMFLDFLAKKRVDTTSLVTHKFPLARYQQAFDTIVKKQSTHAIKVVFDFTQE